MDNVWHKFKYHCEIRYETEHAFNFDKAVGDDITELIIDIEETMEKYKNRFPKIIEAIYDPNNKRLNITPKVLAILKMRAIKH